MGRIAKILLLFFLVSAVPIAYIISLELANPATTVYSYHSSGFFRECAQWDNTNARFLVSFFEGGIAQIVPSSSDAVLKEETLVRDVDLLSNASLGISIDTPRNRLLVAVADLLGNRYSALAAYDLSTWSRLFLTQLSGPSDKAMADDVAVDSEGNAYVTDFAGNKIWKVGVDGKFLSTIQSPLFTPKEWYKNMLGLNMLGLNGIAYHPDGFLIAIHTSTGNLFKIDLVKGDEVQLIELVGGTLSFGDGIHLLSPKKLVVAGSLSTKLVESNDGWETAFVAGTFKGPRHRVATAATVKDGKVYVNHMLGLGYPKKKHVIVEAVFS